MKWKTVAIAALFVASCGPSEKVTVKIVTQNLTPTASLNLAEKLTSVPRLLGPNCTQSNLFALMANGGEGSPLNLTLKRFSISSPTYTTYSISNDFSASWMNSNSTSAANIQVEVTRGVPVDVGIAGQFTVPHDLYPSTDGICDTTDNTPATLNSTSLLGHQRIENPQANMTVNLKVWGIKASHSPAPVPSPAYDAVGNMSITSGMSGSFPCTNINSTADCPIRDFATVKLTGSLSIKKIRYGFDAQSGEAITLFAPSDTSIYIPEMGAIEVTIHDPMNNELIVDMPTRGLQVLSFNGYTGTLTYSRPGRGNAPW